MNITAKDVGRKAVDADGWCWEIVHFGHDHVFPVTGRCQEWARPFKANGEAKGGERLSLIRFADEPSAEPPETAEVGVDEFGWPFVTVEPKEWPRTDLAGTTWRYSKPERVK